MAERRDVYSNDLMTLSIEIWKTEEDKWDGNLIASSEAGDIILHIFEGKRTNRGIKIATMRKANEIWTMTSCLAQIGAFSQTMEPTGKAWTPYEK